MSTIERYRNELYRAFPQANVINEALAGSDNLTPLFFMQEIRNGDLKGCWYVVGRLGPRLERQFRINGEVLFLFSKWPDFQRRSYNEVTRELLERVKLDQEGGGGFERFTPDKKVILVVSPDPNGKANISAWNADGAATQVAYLPAGELVAEVQRQRIVISLAATLGSRDLYSGKNAVTGTDFFGRRRLLGDLSAAIDGGQNIALFGIRRSGKTSVLRELERRALRKQVVFSITDLEHAKEVAGLPAVISGDLLNAMRAAKDKGVKLWIGSEAEQAKRIDSVDSLKDRLAKVAIKNPEVTFVIAVDEIEWLTSLVKADPMGVRLLLGALKASAQAVPNIRLFFTGTSNTVFTQSMLGEDQDNPVFGFVDSWYLNHFALEDSSALLSDLGEPMMLDWRESGLSLAHEVTGGLPFFLRSLGSAVRAMMPDISHQRDDFGPIEIDDSVVVSALDTWASEAGNEWRQIVQAIESHYPGAAQLLESESDENLNEWLFGDAAMLSAAGTLTSLGLLEKREGRFSRSVGLKSLSGLVSDDLRGAQRGLGSLSENALRALIHRGESSVIEFKQSARVNAKTGEKDSRMEDEIVKSVAAFLNSMGGDLLIGVADDGSVCGVDADIAVTRNADYYEQWLNVHLLSRRISALVVSQNVHVELLRLDGVPVAHVRVAASLEPSWATFGREEKLIIRNGNATEELSGSGITAFVRSRG